MNEPELTDYAKYRGKCKELSEALIKERPELTLVRGYYNCPIWGRQQHWWTEDADGNIYDPTKAQFPSGGLGEYIKFDGYYSCEHCGKSVHEDDENMAVDGHHIYCSARCYATDIGMAHYL